MMRLAVRRRRRGSYNTTNCGLIAPPGPSWRGGGPVSSSAPGSRSKALHPLAGLDLTRAALGNVQWAAVPAYNMPAKRVQCQQGRCSGCHGVKWCALIIDPIMRRSTEAATVRAMATMWQPKGQKVEEG